jgi:hypothetical protein
MKKLFILLLTSITIYACQINYITNTPYDVVALSKDLNVCNQLKDSAVIYAIFIDANNFHTWTEYAVNSTLDSLRRATDWISSQAKRNGIDLKIKTVHHLDGSKISFQKRKTGTYFNLNKKLTYNKSKKTDKNSVLNRTIGRVMLLNMLENA